MKTTDLLQSLSDAHVSYVLVGGLAVQLHGFLRATFDVDLVLAMDDANLARFIEVAKHFCLVPAIPVPIESLRSASQIDQWHREKGMLESVGNYPARCVARPIRMDARRRAQPMAAPLASPTTRQALHWAATRRERENRAHCGVARSWFGVTKRRRSRLALHPDSPCSHSPHKCQQTLEFSLREAHSGGGVVDILVRPEMSFEKLRANAVAGALFGRQVWIASIEDMIAMKRSANRPKDQLDITALEKIRRGEDPNA